MKNQDINLTTATAAEIAAAGLVTKNLKKRGPRKGETHFTNGYRTSQGAGQVNPNLTQNNQAANGCASTGGRWSSGHGQRGIGATATRNLEGVKANFKAQAKADRKAAAADRRAERNA